MGLNEDEQSNSSHTTEESESESNHNASDNVTHSDVNNSDNEFLDESFDMIINCVCEQKETLSTSDLDFDGCSQKDICKSLYFISDENKNAMDESISIDHLEKNSINNPVEFLEGNPNINTNFVQKQDGTETVIHEPVFVDSTKQNAMNKSTFDSHKEYTVASSNHISDLDFDGCFQKDICES